MLEQFKNPPAEYRVSPIWFWNTKPTISEVERQIREMYDKGIGGFFIVESVEACNTGYLKDWLNCISFAKSLAKELGMFAYVCQRNPWDGRESAQLSGLNLYKTAQEPAVGGIVDIPLPNESALQALLLHSGWSCDLSNSDQKSEGLDTSDPFCAGLKRVVCTPFSDPSWDLSPAQMKAILDQAAVLGANTFSPRSFIYSILDCDHAEPLPSQFYQSTFWPHYKQFADYAARLCYAISQGEHKAQIALLNPVSGLAYELSQHPTGIPHQLALNYFNMYCECLLKEHIDYDVVLEESISKSMVLDQRLVFDNEEYGLLILPPTTCLAYETAARIAEYVEDGGCLLATTLLPFRDADGERHDEVRGIFSDMFEVEPEELRAKAVDGNTPQRPVLSHNSASLLFYECADASELAHGIRGMVSMAVKPEVSIAQSGSECNDIIYHHRVAGEHDLFFFLNTAPSAREVNMSIRCDKAPYLLDLDTGKVSAIADCTLKGSRTVLDYKFAGNESMLIYFTNDIILPAVHYKSDNSYEVTLADEWIFEINGRNCITLPDWTIANGIQHSSENRQLTTTFSVDANLQELLCVFENRSHEGLQFSVLVNGVPASGTRGWILDVNMEAVDITNLIRPGVNEIRLVSHTKSANNTPPRARLMGAFSLDDSNTVLMPPRAAIRTGSWTEQGYPYFSGTASYAQEVEIPELIHNQRVLLRANGPADIVEFFVNGDSAGTRSWFPFEVDITGLAKIGSNSIVIKVTNSLANAMLSEPRRSGLLNGARLIIS